jgi:SCY1-like protein 1
LKFKKTALNFLNNDCKQVHNNISIASIFVTKAGEWKLSGLEFTHNISDEPIANKVSVLSSLAKYEPPEKQSPGSKIQADFLWSLDSWGFGCLIWEIFNGVLTNTNSLKNFGKIPKRLQPVYTELVNGTPRNRLPMVKFLDICRNRNGFMDNHFVNTLFFLEKIQVLLKIFFILVIYLIAVFNNFRSLKLQRKLNFLLN